MVLLAVDRDRAGVGLLGRLFGRRLLRGVVEHLAPAGAGGARAAGRGGSAGGAGRGGRGAGVEGQRHGLVEVAPHLDGGDARDEGGVPTGDEGRVGAGEGGG